MTENNFDSYNAPQFFDFDNDLHQEENVDAYFEIDHESVPQADPSEDPLRFRNSEELQVEEDGEFYSPLKTTPAHKPNYPEIVEAKPRRSMSVGNLQLLCDTDSNESNETSKEEVITSEPRKCGAKSTSSNCLRKAGSNTSLYKNKAGPSRISAPRLTRAASKESLDRLAQPKRYGSTQNLNQGNYVTLAEAVRKFQSGTPTRFRSKPKMAGGVFNKLGATIPQSPALMTKARHRPVQSISTEEREIQAFEEAQKFKIRANPLNKKMLHGPMKPLIAVEKKPTTVVEPFNITAPKKAAESLKEETFEFHAKPVPKVVYEPPKLKEVQKIHKTNPLTPTFMKRYARELVRPQENNEELAKQPAKLGRTTPVPFSFAKRDEFIQKKRENLIKKVMEEEKKAREFHARPIPKAILNSGKNSSNLQRSSSSQSNLTRSEENLTTQFKAKPPTVLYKKPFEPKLERHLIEITEFELNTEKRAKEREEFEQLKREKEEKIERAKQLEEELRLHRENEEVARIRKEAEHKAQPIKKYKELKIEPSGKVTEPISPNFHTDRIRNKENKENLN